MTDLTNNPNYFEVTVRIGQGATQFTVHKGVLMQVDDGSHLLHLLEQAMLEAEEHNKRYEESK